MGIAVLLKQVPDTTAKISVSGGRVDESGVLDEPFVDVSVFDPTDVLVNNSFAFISHLL